MNFIKEFLKGILIGVANIIPGVSGGTMAVSMGVYDKMITAITGIRKQWKQSLLTLLPYILGAVAGIGALSFLVEFGLRQFPLPTSGLFIGLVIGGIPLIVKKVQGERISVGKGFLFLLFFALVVGMAFMNGNESSATEISLNIGAIIQLFFVGVVASATMVIPGVSGSLVMMILGFYGIIISSISKLIEALTAFDVSNLFQSVGVLAPFGIGILLGIGVIAKVIELLFAKVPVLTYYAILGLVFGSPIAIIYKMESVTVNVMSILATVIAFVVGFVITYFLGSEE